MNKKKIEKYAVEIRRVLVDKIAARLKEMGIDENQIVDKSPASTDSLEFYSLGATETALKGKEIVQRKKLVDKLLDAGFRNGGDKSANRDAYQNVVEEAAFTQFDRLIALRFMEVNGYLPGQIRIFSSATPGKREPDVVTNPFDSEFEFNDEERETIERLLDANKTQEVFRLLFFKLCDDLNKCLPGLFKSASDDDYNELLFSLDYNDPQGPVYRLVDEISEDDFNVSAERSANENDADADARAGQVEIVGWFYQYYNAEAKERVFANLKKNIKIDKENIPAATQLFTPDWIVRYMVENSLGRLWLESRPEDADALKPKWKYYLDEAPQEPDVQARLDEIRAKRRGLRPEEIRCFDPCMGSGHILVYFFDALTQIYDRLGYSPRDSVRSILENNLFGLDVDDRAGQLAYFAVMMKARQYDRRFFERPVQPFVYAIQATDGIDEKEIERLANGDVKTLKELTAFVKYFADAKNPGSLLTPTGLDFDALDERLKTVEKQGALDLRQTAEKIRNAIPAARLLSLRYDVVVTNPPYMGASNMNSNLSTFVKENYPDSKNDLSTAFMERTLAMCDSGGCVAMLNIPVWMFLSSYEKLRGKMLENNTLTTMAHFGRGVFGSDFGTTAFVVAKERVPSYLGTYRRLFEKQGAVDSVETKEKWFLEGKNRYTAKQENFAKIPGAPIAYWWSNFLIFDFPAISSFYESAGRNKTHNNELYVRIWWEISNKEKWQPYANGGTFRRWGGNDLDVVDWSQSAQKKYASKGGLYNQKFNGKQGICWNLITSYKNGFRIKQKAHHYSSAAPTIIADTTNYDYYLLALLNSSVVSNLLSIFNPTLNTTVGDVLGIPLIIKQENSVDSFSNENISLSKTDWDSFETSWDFVRHPFVRPRGADSVLISDRFAAWESECSERFARLKSNEEELNRIFIEIYGLGDELTPEVEPKDVTVRLADKERDVKSFVSYAVGCMFGRYSLDVDGLAFAGGAWDASKYATFPADADNAIPIVDDSAYAFDDDAVGLFVRFTETVFGRETLEANLRFIADALGGRNLDSRDAIRKYFLTDFFKDHCKTYQNRPIYWQFDSGKANGFKALFYLHRYNRDTIGRMRVDYLHKIQAIYETQIKHCEQRRESTSENKSALSKQIEKYRKQLDEVRAYEVIAAHLALAQIELDLDDGVKVNYEKIQRDPDGKSYPLLTKIK